MHRINGIVLEPHSETLGMSGIEKLWKPEPLAEAADTLAGNHITNSSSMGPENVVGKVTYAEYRDGEGVYYEAEIHDDDVAELLDAGPTRLAPRMTHESLSADDEPVEPEDIEFDGLFVTAHPAEGVPDNPE